MIIYASQDGRNNSVLSSCERFIIWVIRNMATFPHKAALLKTNLEGKLVQSLFNTCLIRDIRCKNFRKMCIIKLMH
jgi:hypothetical protein